MSRREIDPGDIDWGNFFLGDITAHVMQNIGTILQLARPTSVPRDIIDGWKSGQYIVM